MMRVRRVAAFCGVAGRRVDSTRTESESAPKRLVLVGRSQRHFELLAPDAAAPPSLSPARSLPSSILLCTIANISLEGCRNLVFLEHSSETLGREFTATTIQNTLTILDRSCSEKPRRTTIGNGSSRSRLSLAAGQQRRQSPHSLSHAHTFGGGPAAAAHTTRCTQRVGSRCYPS